MEVPFSWPNHTVLPKTPLSETLTLGFRISTYGFWRHTNVHGILWNQRIIKPWFKEGISSIPSHLPLANAGMKLGWKMFGGQVQRQLACAFLLFMSLNGKFQNHFLSDRSISPHLPLLNESVCKVTVFTLGLKQWSGAFLLPNPLATVQKCLYKILGLCGTCLKTTELEHLLIISEPL